MNTELIKQITKHLDFCLSQENIICLAQRILQEYPKYAYSGIAYRAVILFSNESLDYSRLSHPGQSWAINEEGRNAYIKSESKHFKDEVIFLVEANIMGVHLTQFIKEELPELTSSISNYLKEDEIISMELISIEKISDEILATNFKLK